MNSLYSYNYVDTVEVVVQRRTKKVVLVFVF
jgi:hypothetical protein